MFRKKTVFILFFIFVLGSFPYQSQGAAKKGKTAVPQKKLVRLTFSSGWDALPALVAMERGFFDREQLVVSGLTVSSATAVMRSVASLTTDFASVPQRTLLAMAALKLPIKAISLNGWGREIELVTRKENTKIKTIKDLKGKTIAMTRGSEVLPVLIRLANKEKILPTELKVKYLPANKLTRAFKDKFADAVLESRHFTSVLIKGGGGRLVLRNQDIVSAIGFIGTTPLVTSNALIKKDPDTVQKFVNAWIKALISIRQDPDGAARLLKIFFHRQGVDISKPLARSWVRMTRYDRYYWSSVDLADAKYNGWGLKEGGVLKIAPKLDDYIENRFALKTLSELKKRKGRKRK